MKLNFFFINTLIAILAIFFGINIFSLWFPAKKEIGEIKSPPINKTSIKKINKKKLPPLNKYDIITKKNLFNPDRKEKSSSDNQLDINKGQLSKKYILYGIFINDNEKSALILDNNLKRNERKARWIKTGENLGAFEIAEILADRVVLTDNSQKIEILLNDPDNPKIRKAKPKASLSKRKKAVRKKLRSVKPKRKLPPGIRGHN